MDTKQTVKAFEDILLKADDIDASIETLKTQKNVLEKEANAVKKETIEAIHVKAKEDLKDIVSKYGLSVLISGNSVIFENLREPLTQNSKEHKEVLKEVTAWFKENYTGLEFIFEPQYCSHTRGSVEIACNIHNAFSRF